MRKNTEKLLREGHSIVPSLVEIGIESHRPIEAMTDEIINVNKKFGNLVENKQELTDYLTQELQKAKQQYKNKIKEYLD